MTQDQLRLLSIVSLSALALSVFSLPTLICLTIATYCTYRYLIYLVKMRLSRGLIQLCPQSIKNQLMNKSIFDFICSIWFQEWFIFLKSFFKVLFKPLVEPIEPQNSIEALNDISQNCRQVILQKGVIRSMPISCQQLLLGSQRFKQQRRKFEYERDNFLNHMVEEANSDKNTRDRSRSQDNNSHKANSQSKAPIYPRMIEERWSGTSEQRVMMPIRRNLRSPIILKSKKQQPKGIIQTLHNSLHMLKSIVEIHKIGGKIKKIKSGTIVKLMMVSWIALLLQVRYTKSARKTMIKTMHVMGGIVTVLGIVGSTGVLVYKHWSTHQELEGEEQEE